MVLDKPIVIFDFLSDPMGGLLTSAREFLKRVREYDSESKIIVLELNKSISPYVNDSANIEWINVNRPNGLLGWRRILWQNVNLPNIIKKNNATVYVSLSHYLPWTLPRNIKKIIGISNLAPFSKAAFDAEVSWKKKLRLILLSKSIIVSSNRADTVIALSNACKQELLLRGVSEQKVVIIPNGVSVYQHYKTNNLAIKNEHYVLCVSHFYRYKNYERLVKAFYLLPESLKNKYSLFLVGKPYDIKYFNKIITLVKSLDMENNVILITGLFGDDLINAYKNCSLFVFPSLIENSPITLLEAMIYGAPTIASDVPAMREFGQQSIIYFDSTSEVDLTHKMEQLLQNKKQRQSLEQAGIMQASKYTWNEFSLNLVNTYLKFSLEVH